MNIQLNDYIVPIRKKIDVLARTYSITVIVKTGPSLQNLNYFNFVSKYIMYSLIKKYFSLIFVECMICRLVEDSF